MLLVYTQYSKTLDRFKLAIFTTRWCSNQTIVLMNPVNALKYATR